MVAPSSYQLIVLIYQRKQTSINDEIVQVEKSENWTHETRVPPYSEREGAKSLSVVEQNTEDSKLLGYV